MATVNGTSGSDSLGGTASNDTLNGLGGNDTLVGSGGTDFYDGGAGRDILDLRATLAALTLDFTTGTLSGGFNGSFTGIEVVKSGDGADSLTGAAGGQNFSGRGGSDTLAGGAGIDTLWGGTEADHFVFREFGSANADQISDWSSGSDKIVLDAAVFTGLGGDFFTANASGTAQDAGDRIIFETDTRQVWYDADGNGAGARQLIATLQVGGTLVATDILVEGGSSGGGGQTINGTAGNDLLVGDAGNDTISGLAGNDTLRGLGGDDSLHGGSGSNLLDGGDGNDTLNTVDGFLDTVDGGLGVDTQIMRQGTAGAGVEHIILRGYEDVGVGDVKGNELDNTIINEGTEGIAFLDGHGGNDTLVGGSVQDLFSFSGGASGDSYDYGHDSVDGGGGIDWLLFEGNPTSVTVDFRNGSVIGGGSPVAASVAFVNIEIAQGTLFADAMYASGDGDQLRGYGGGDTLTGGAGADILVGDEGWDHPTVAPGNDRLLGGGGNDAVNGEEGDDWVDGGAGNDALMGGEGADRFSFSAAPGAANADRVEDFSSADDQIVLDGAVHASSGPSGSFNAGDARFWSSTTGTAHDMSDRVIYNTATGELWYDADGNGAGARQLIATLEGAPTLAATDIEIINGSGGGEDGQVINGTSGNDTLAGTAGNDTINGLDGRDVILAGATGGADVVDGGAHFDTLDFDAGATSGVVVDFTAGSVTGGSSGTISFASIERIIGSDFGDRLSGNAAPQTLNGGAGADTLSGGGGLDVLRGGAGADAFVYREAASGDQVLDFASGTDRFELDDAAFTAIGAAGAFAAADSRFWASSSGAAHDANDRVLFNTTTGQLFYDADGTGGGAAQLIATVQSGASVAAGDIVVI